MGRYTGPKVKLSRRVGVPIADIPKHTAKELTLPGMHGYRGRRNTEYGVRLTEKQKLRFHYGMLEKQFRRFLDIAKKSKGNTANSLMQLLESRLDNVLRRLGVGRTIWATRQIVAHGHVHRGRPQDRHRQLPREARADDHLQGRHPQGAPRQHGAERRPQRARLAGVESRPADRQGQRACRSPEDVPFEVNMNLIIEFYR